MDAFKYYVDIISYDESGMIKSLGPYESERTAEKAERGVNYQLNHDRFYTQIRKENS